MPDAIELTGTKFGRLTVTGKDTERKAYWICKCECGNVKNVYRGDLRRGKSKSCGCLKIEKATTHGMSRSTEYVSWNCMMERCNNEKAPNFSHYGGRGISVCSDWRDFNKFISTMGKKPSPTHSIERRDVNGNYEPSNCYWATTLEQSRNRRVLISRSRIPGVSWSNKKQRWIARIYINKKVIHIGTFINMDDAAKARKKAETIYYGKESS